jgi:hypothetical protein
MASISPRGTPTGDIEQGIAHDAETGTGWLLADLTFIMPKLPKPKAKKVQVPLSIFNMFAPLTTIVIDE